MLTIIISHLGMKGLWVIFFIILTFYIVKQRICIAILSEKTIIEKDNHWPQSFHLNHIRVSLF